MEKLSIKSKNIVKIEVNDDGEYITINFADADFPKRFYQFYNNMKKKIDSIQKDREKFNESDVEQQLEYYAALHRELMQEVDGMFGEDTCRKVFGDITPNISLISDFFEQLFPIMEKYSLVNNRAFSGKYSPGRKGNR